MPCGMHSETKSVLNNRFKQDVTINHVNLTGTFTEQRDNLLRLSDSIFFLKTILWYMRKETLAIWQLIFFTRIVNSLNLPQLCQHESAFRRMSNIHGSNHLNVYPLSSASLNKLVAFSKFEAELMNEWFSGRTHLAISSQVWPTNIDHLVQIADGLNMITLRIR